MIFMRPARQAGLRGARKAPRARARPRKAPGTMAE